MPNKILSLLQRKNSPDKKLSSAIFNLVVRIPASREQTSPQPALAARQITQAAARKAAIAAGSLALPPGPLGWLTLLPELLAVWRIQAQLVSDLAALYGKRAQLNREQMAYCLFRHLASQAVRDLVVRAGERFLVTQASSQLLQSIIERIGKQIAHKLLGKSVSRWLPLLGAIGVGAYAYFDTRKVATTAIALFEKEIALQAAPISKSTDSTLG
ncbi:MAG: EcsC family protein [Pseudomonadota bacterium]